MKILLLPAFLLSTMLFTGCDEHGVGVVAVHHGPGYYDGGPGYYERRDVYVHDRPYHRGPVVVNDRTNVTRVNRTTNVTNVAVNKRTNVVRNQQSSAVVQQQSKKKKKQHQNGDDRDHR
jgi:hypothetical protein